MYYVDFLTRYAGLRPAVCRQRAAVPAALPQTHERCVDLDECKSGGAQRGAGAGTTSTKKGAGKGHKGRAGAMAGVGVGVGVGARTGTRTGTGARARARGGAV